MGNSRFLIGLLISFLLFVGISTFASRALAQEEDCIQFMDATVAFEDGSWKIVQGDIWLLDFGDSEQEAEMALSIIEHYGFNNMCFVGRPDASMIYWLVDGRSPQGSFPGEDCIQFMYATVAFEDGSWKIVQGDIWLLDFGDSEQEARTALSLIQKYGFGYICYVGRPDASMEYYRTDPDSDGDGLLDSWERFGLDADGDGVIDIDLPGFGADPDHKDLFLEFDWMNGQAPTRAAIQTLKAAFAAAPINAGGINNPDGLPGINLWVDTGNLIDATASEDGAGANTCGDGIDNGPDGTMDANDPDCLVGDNLGGGNAMAASGISNLNADFYAAKAANFNTNRSMVFRYGISAQPGGFGGGWGEIGGNDFIEYNHDSGTIMHELGHTLNLRHGGDVNDNCKPVYVSVMNYDIQFGINQAGGGTIIDYSPPRFPGGRGFAPLPTIVEDDINESIILDSTDAFNRFVFVNSIGNKIQWQLNGQDIDGDGIVDGVNWNSNSTPGEDGLTVNVDTSGSGGRPALCANADDDSTLTGHDDWSVIALNFRPFGDSADGAINPVTELEPDLNELTLIQEQLNTTDVMIEKSADQNPVEVGNDLVYTLKVTNNGPNPASSVQVVDDLPDLVSYKSNTAGCSIGLGVLTCNMGELLFGEYREIDITVVTDNVCIDGIPSTITNQADVDNTAEFAIETDTENDSVTLTMTPVDTTPPLITCPSNTTIECDQSPDPVLTGSASATDVCDSSPAISFSDTVEPGTCSDEHTITRTWTATDASFNSSSCVQTIEVVDTTPPEIQCNAQPTITPPDAPISFTATAIDNCDDSPAVEIKEFDCYNYTKKGKKIDKTLSCIVEVNGDTITILDSGGVGDNITWIVHAEDNSGNEREKQCLIEVVRYKK
jgi:uncharacterized repeat protein (TIGR01451 family)